MTYQFCRGFEVPLASLLQTNARPTQEMIDDCVIPDGLIMKKEIARSFNVKNDPATPIPDHLRREFVWICRADLPAHHTNKVHQVMGYRIEQIQNGEEAYPIEWWSEVKNPL